jgi:hypothetical protein
MGGSRESWYLATASRRMLTCPTSPVEPVVDSDQSKSKSFQKSSHSGRLSRKKCSPAKRKPIVARQLECSVSCLLRSYANVSSRKTVQNQKRVALTVSRSTGSIPGLVPLVSTSSLAKLSLMIGVQPTKMLTHWS